MSRPVIHHKLAFETIDKHKSELYQDNQHKGKIWFIKGKIVLDANDANVNDIREGIEAISNRFMKANTKRYIISLDDKETSKKSKITYVSYTIVFMKRGTLQEIYELMTPMIGDLDKIIEKFS